MVEHFRSVEAANGHSGYFYSVGETLAIVILGSLCGLKNVNQIHQWATSGRVKGFLRENFGSLSGADRERYCLKQLCCLA